MKILVPATGMRGKHVNGKLLGLIHLVWWMQRILWEIVLRLVKKHFPNISRYRYFFIIHVTFVIRRVFVCTELSSKLELIHIYIQNLDLLFFYNKRISNEFSLHNSNYIESKISYFFLINFLSSFTSSFIIVL